MIAVDDDHAGAHAAAFGRSSLCLGRCERDFDNRLRLAAQQTHGW